MYRFWVFVHIAGVFAFLVTHGLSVFATFRLRSERDPRKVSDLIELSGATIMPFWVSTGVLLLGGTVAGFLGHWWGRAWIWASIAILVLTTIAMYVLARPHFRKVGTVARALANGSKAVTEEQFVGLLRSGRSLWMAGIGTVGFLAIVYLMMFKPALGIDRPARLVAASTDAVAGEPGVNLLRIEAHDSVAFATERLTAPAGVAFAIEFSNLESGVPHNVGIYADDSASEVLFVGDIVDGPASVTYSVPALAPGDYYFRCDVHPLMDGTLTAG